MLLRKFILLCGGVQLTWLLITFWFFNYSPFNIPKFIPGTPINIVGLSSIAFWIAAFIFFEKRLLRAEPEATIWDLTSLAAFSGLAAEVVFQLIRQFTFPDSSPVTHVEAYLGSVLLMSVYAAVLGFLVAFQLKTRKVGWIIGFIILAIIFYNLFGGKV
jgi:hypothetical protein